MIASPDTLQESFPLGLLALLFDSGFLLDLNPRAVSLPHLALGSIQLLRTFSSLSFEEASSLLLQIAIRSRRRMGNKVSLILYSVDFCNFEPVDLYVQDVFCLF